MSALFPLGQKNSVPRAKKGWVRKKKIIVGGGQTERMWKDSVKESRVGMLGGRNTLNKKKKAGRGQGWWAGAWDKQQV